MRAQQLQDSPQVAFSATAVTHLSGPVGLSSGFVVRVRREATRTWVTPVGELDLATAQEFDRVVWEAQTDSAYLTVDLRALTFVDAVGIRSLIGARLRASSWHRRLEVVCASGQVRRMLALTGVDELLGVISPAEPQVHRTARARRHGELRLG